MAETFRIPVIDYTSRDYLALRNDMLNLVPFFTEEWTDLNPSDFGVVLLELMAGIGDCLHYYIDRNALEGFLPSAITRKSVVNLCKLINFTLPGAASATVELEFTVEVDKDNDITVPVGTECQTSDDDPYIFETSSPLIIPNDLLAADTDGTADVYVASSVDAAKYQPGWTVEISDDSTFEVVSRQVVAVDGTKITLSDTVPSGYTTGNVAFIRTKKAQVSAQEGRSDEEDAGLSDGTAYQRFTLTKTPIVEGSVYIYVNEGGGEQEWTIVETLVGQAGSSPALTLTRDEDDQVVLEFGDNGQGKIPVSGATIRAEFKLGGGKDTNVGANTINVLNDTIYLSGQPVAMSVNNPEKASGGDDRMSIETAKIQGPRSFQTMGRAVSITDIRVLSELYPGVAAARAVVSGGFVNVHIVPTGGGMPTSQLKSDLQDYLDGIKAAGTPLVVKDPILVPIKITGVIVYKPTFNPDDIETGTEEAIAEFFDPESQYIAFGRSIYLSDILALLDGLVVNNLAAIDHVSFSVCTRDPSPRLLIWTGDAVFSNFVISGTTIDETWTVVFTSPTTFSVTGSVSGLQAATGTVGVQYTTDNDELSFLLSNSGSPMAPADKATIKVSEPFGDVELDEDEFPTIGTLTFSYVKADA